MSRPLRVAVVIVLAAAAVLVVLDRTVVPLAPLRAAGSAVYGTAQNVVGLVTRSFGGQDRIAALEQENARLRADLQASGFKAESSVQLGRLNVSVPARKGVAAHVVGYGRQSVTLDAGAADGLVRDVTVLNADGLVGKVSWAGPATSSVSLITDASSSVGARMVGSGELGLVTGLPGEGKLRLSLFDPNAELKAGDQVVTLGSAGQRPYVPGVPIGTVESVVRAPGAATRIALVRPAARLSALDLVSVIVPASKG
ncbi:rod shape-determining protein MreC [Nonomuraea sp. NN258]|uniref:rod shape-determining protein MreC n=1 Tax=Nonomuraea antri TaxID=2730852 RepID=UPI0015694C1C|nr:rod shape-determining protein MreC [Nonomuraea antri]NRQ36243.1 rod shape-determining protein MreC [Nonomuraea antri]